MLTISQEAVVAPDQGPTVMIAAPTAVVPERAQRFHMWVLPLLWVGPAAYVAFQQAEKLPAFAFETFIAHWLRVGLTVVHGPESVIISLVTGALECALLGWLMDRSTIRKWAGAFAVLGFWVLLHPNGTLGITCILMSWQLYAIGLFTAVGGLTLQTVRRSARNTDQTAPV